MAANPANDKGTDAVPGAAQKNPAGKAGTPHAGAAVGPIARYDFKKPGRADRKLLRALHELHSGFATEFAASLAALVRNTIEVKLLGVEQLSLRDYFARLDRPACLNVLSAEPLPEHWMVDIQPSILYPLIDNMLGGGRQNVSMIRRPLTDIELRLVWRLGDLLCNDLRRAWRGVIDLQLKLLRAESAPKIPQTVPADDVALVVRFELSLSPWRGLMRVCLPSRAIEPIRDKLSASGGESANDRPVSPEDVERIGRELRDAEAEVRVWLAESRISAKELLDLRVGDIITTQTHIHSPAVVAVEGVPKFHARPGAVRGRKAVVIAEPLKPVDGG